MDKEIETEKWCTCKTIATGERGILITCRLCGGQDAYKKSPLRPSNIIMDGLSTVRKRDTKSVPLIWENCSAGCIVFENGETKHTKGCVNYKGSLSEMYDIQKRKNNE
ncbi:MAG: hypothetical protein V3V00_15890 [Saprospiraceae bacterium]